MGTSEFNTIACTASLHPHGHQYEHEGPWSLRIGVQGQPNIVQAWDSKTILLSIEQPNKEDNFTLIRALFLRSGRVKPSFVREQTFHRVRWHRRPDDVIEIRLKRKLGKLVPHPVPIGKYDGSCFYDAGGGFTVFNLQAMTLHQDVERSTPKTIITPGDQEYNVTLRDAKRTLS